LQGKNREPALQKSCKTYASASSCISIEQQYKTHQQQNNHQQASPPAHPMKTRQIRLLQMSLRTYLQYLRKNLKIETRK